MAAPASTGKKAPAGGFTRNDVALVVAVLFGALLVMPLFAEVLAALDDSIPLDLSGGERYPDAWYSSPDGGDEYDALAAGIFDTWAVPFEALSMLLLVALIGAIAIAAPNPDDDRGGLS